MRKILLISVISFIAFALHAQKEAYNWFLPVNVGMSFHTEPPTAISNGSLNTGIAGSSISDSNGNLLFYTNGLNIWNSQHAFMANGTGLIGSPAADQIGLSIKKPGSSSLYYVFTNTVSGQNPGLTYSIIDLTLAAGLGSVTTKNVPLLSPASEKMAICQHCNGTDYWLLTHESNTDKFVSFLINASGISAPVISAAGISYTTGTLKGQGLLKFSPNGKKIGCVIAETFNIELYDFDNSTGVVSNPVTLGPFNNIGVIAEFSPSSGKFYAGFGSHILQWDLCSTSQTVLINSKDTIAKISGMNSIGRMQLAPNGKIYVARTNVDSIPVINYPDIKGTGCNYIHSAQPLPPNGTNSFPMFSNDQIRPNFSFTTTASCSKANFTIPQSCMNSANTYTWNFGDTFSGTANTSTIINPSHIFSSAGAYTVTLTINTGCAPYSVSRTLTVQSSPSFTITGKQKICKGESTIITLSGADSYSWSSGQSTHTVALNPTVTTVYTVITTFTANSCSGLKTVTVTVSDCLGLTSQYGEESFIIFPNPGSGHYLITATENGRLTISNNTGSNCIVREINKGQNNLDISQLPIGIYIFSLSTSNGVLVKKLIKESE